jgi:tetratricopeptide (TPR) repeat protein
MLRKGGEKGLKGPMPRAVVLNGLARGRYSGDDRVSAVGGEEFALADHPDFRGCFIPGSKDDLEIERMRVELDAIARRAKNRRILHTSGGVFLFLLSGVMVWFSANSQLLLMPVTWRVEVEETLHWWQGRAEPGTQFDDVVTEASLPHRDWVKAHPKDINGASLHLAMAAHWSTPGLGLDQVRRLYLQAMATHPLDPMPLAGLIEIDAAMLYSRPALLGEISRAISRLEALRAEGPGMDAALGGLALAQGKRSSAKKYTEECAKTDAVCAILHGEASLDTGEIEAVIARLGPQPRSLRALCRTALAAGEWDVLEKAVTRLIALTPDDPEGFEFYAEGQAALGRWGLASSAAAQAVALGTERAEIVHLRAAVVLASGSVDEGLIEMFDSLMMHPHLGGHTSRQTVLIQAAQLRIGVGDLAGAREIVDSALDSHAKNQAASVVLAIILSGEGRFGDAESVLREIDTNGMAPPDGAAIHRWTARLYLDMGKQRLARQEIENALRLDPSSQATQEERIWAAISAGDVNGALLALEKLVSLAPARSIDTDPREGLGLTPPARRNLAGPFLKAMDADIRYAPEREPVSALLGWWAGRPGHLAHLLDAANGHPNHLSLQMAIAKAAFASGDWALAEENAVAVVSRKPSMTVMHSIRGRSLAMMGRWPEAVDPLKRSVKSDSGQVELLRLAAEAWAEHGDVEMAITLLDEAKKIAPWDARIRRALFALSGAKK